MSYTTLYIKISLYEDDYVFEAIIGNSNTYKNKILYDNCIYMPTCYIEDNDNSKINFYLNKPEYFKRLYLTVEKPEYINDKYVCYKEYFGKKAFKDFLQLFSTDIDPSEIEDNTIMLY